ncbi:Hypothetical protein HDN1F_29460 [gamma proteobacterium HdN1]|nr:Hypothetical protein HDN1F_29460 [gamma proteobacterium HdN1]
MTAESRKLAGARVGIPPRQMKFQRLGGTPRYFFADNAASTLFLAVLSGIFPPGERFFVESVRNFRETLSDPTLKAKVSGFIGQEAMHGREHERLNQILKDRGIDAQVPEKAVQMALDLLRYLPQSTQLAATTFMEHFTALLGEALLTDEAFIQYFDAEMVKLWQWHALEEMEHKSVAFDVYETVGNSQRERQFATAAVLATVLPALLASWVYLVAKEGKLTDIRDLKRGISIIIGKNGVITRFLPKMPRFWARNYHPNEHDTRHIEQEWREKLFGKNGILNAEFTNREAVTGNVA